MCIFEEEVSERQFDACLQKLTGKTKEELRQASVLNDIAFIAGRRGKSMTSLTLLTYLQAMHRDKLPLLKTDISGVAPSRFVQDALFEKHEGDMNPWNDTAIAVCHSLNKRGQRTTHPSTLESA